MIVFTRIDDLEHDNKILKDYVENTENQSLTEIITLCKSNYFGLSNRWDSNDQKTVAFKEKFVSTIDTIVQTNNNEFYTSIQFETSIKHYEAEKTRLEQELINSKQNQEKLEKLMREQQLQAYQFNISIQDFEAEKMRLEQETFNSKQTQDKLNNLVKDQQEKLDELTRKANEMGKGGCSIL